MESKRTKNATATTEEILAIYEALADKTLGGSSFVGLDGFGMIPTEDFNRCVDIISKMKYPEMGYV